MSWRVVSELMDQRAGAQRERERGPEYRNRRRATIVEEFMNREMVSSILSASDRFVLGEVDE